MRYLGFAMEPDGERRVVVGGGRRPAGALTLSHHTGTTTPAELRADTNAGIVLNLLRSRHGGDLLQGIELVSSERCDADALLGVWALLEPEAALARADHVEDAARAGAFRVRRSPEAAQFACWVTGFREQEGLHDEDAAFRAMLPLVAGVLDRPRDHDLYWIGQYSNLIHDGAMLHSGAVQIEEYPELDLAVMETPLSLHDLVRFSAVSGFRLLTVRSENTYTLEYRRESGVQYQSRRPLPRIDLQPLASRLNFFERGAGRWRAEPVAAPTPRLFVDAGSGRPAPSAIDAETVIAEVLDFFRGNASRRELHWSPYPAAPEA